MALRSLHHEGREEHEVRFKLANRSLMMFEEMRVGITLQANNDDFIYDCTAQAVISSMRRALQSDIPYYAHVWYGWVSSDSPLLSFACFPGVGVYIAITQGWSVSIYVDSDDFSVSYPIRWGEDSVKIPLAYIMPASDAERIIGYFCETGGMAADHHWQDDASLDWDLYDLYD